MFQILARAFGFCTKLEKVDQFQNFFCRKNNREPFERVCESLGGNASSQYWQVWLHQRAPGQASEKKIIGEKITVCGLLLAPTGALIVIVCY